MGGGGGGFLGSGLGQALMFTNPLTMPFGVVNSGMIQPQKAAERAAKSQMEDLAKTQQASASALQRQIAEAPKVSASDNFLAMKSKALSALRLGFAGTNTGAAGAAGASILPSGLKSKLGA